MSTVTMLDFRRDPKSIIQRITGGEELILTYRGKAVIRLEPVKQEAPPADDPIYRLSEFAQDAEPLPEQERDREIDRLVYDA
jgi:antitoxin (DNA-binding transcriptional repressor) of toxin-antitoxin stability system